MKNEIPKDLTKELLTIIFDDGKEDCMQKVVQEIVKIEKNELHYTFKWDNNDDMYPHLTSINVDTLCREMKEWCFKYHYNIWSDTIGNVNVQDENFDLVYENGLDSENETNLKTFIKAVAWVAKEKNIV